MEVVFEYKEGGRGGEGPEQLLVIETEQVDEEVEDEGVIKLEKKAVFQYLSDFLRVLLLELFR